MNNGRATIQQSIQQLSIIVPSKKNWFALLFGTAWMGGWFFGFISAFEVLTTDGLDNNGFVVFWLLMWTIGGLGLTGILLWGYFGKEYMAIDKEQVRFEKTIFGLGVKHKLNKAALKNFRVELVKEGWLSSDRWTFWGLGPGKIKFDYGLRTYSFGLGIDDVEAHHIVELLSTRFHQNQ